MNFAKAMAMTISMPFARKDLFFDSVAVVSKSGVCHLRVAPRIAVNMLIWTLRCSVTAA